MSSSGDGSADAAARERLAGEARATAASVLDWLGTRVDGQAGFSDTRPPQSAGPCTWCPVCALVAALRGEAPELTARTAEQVSGLLVLLRLMLAEHGGHQHSAPFSPEPAADPPEHPLHATFDPTPPTAWPAPRASDASSLAFTASESASSPAQPTAPAERPSGRRAPRPSPRRSNEPSAPDASVPSGPAADPGATQPGPGDSIGERGSGSGAPEPGLADPAGPRRRAAAGREPAAPSSSPSQSRRRVVQRIPVRRVGPPGSC